MENLCFGAFWISEMWIKDCKTAISFHLLFFFNCKEGSKGVGMKRVAQVILRQGSSDSPRVKVRVLLSGAPPGAVGCG